MRNHAWSRSVLRVVALGAGVALAASDALAGTTETRTAFGAIEMVEEVRVRDPGEPAIMHVATEWTQLHLRWRSADGVMAVDVVDDGRMITSHVTAGVGASTCATSVNYLQYGGAVGEAEIDDELRSAITRLARLCPVLSVATGAAYARTLADGATDFPAAEDGLRARALDLFKGPPTRCLAPLAPPRPRGRRPPPSTIRIFEPLPCRQPR